MEIEKPDQAAEVKPNHGHTTKNFKKFIPMFLVSILILGIGAGAAYFWRDKQAKDQNKTNQTQITQLKASVTKLEKDLADAKKASPAIAKAPATTCASPTASVLDNIQASITSGNTAALEGYMASSVKVIIAASEGLGARTPVQAVGDVDYLNPGGTNTWDFALPAATIAKYQAGFYKQYFPVGALVGKAADGHVVSFQFDCTGKISGIFMAASADLL